MTGHDSRFCAELGHYIGTVSVIYCPHHQSWTLVEFAGDDADDQALEHATFNFGPFDGTDDVARHAASVVSKLVRVTSRLWLHRRRGDGHDDGGGF